MTTAIAKADDGFPPDRVELLRRTLCPTFSADELALFVEQCVRTGLDPFSRQIHASKRRDRKAGVDKLTIQTGIDGFRLIAARTGELDGQDGPYWCGSDGVWRDVWLERDPPAAAKVTVFRRGCRHGFVGIARFDEYVQQYDGRPSGLWGKMPGVMIAKCAEALALRKAFPQDLSGLYTSEEMAQADNDPEPEPEAAPRGKPVQAKLIDTPAPPPARKALPAPATDEPKALPDTAATLEWLLTEYGRHLDCDADTVLHKLCAAAGWVGVCSTADLDAERVALACESLRRKLAGRVAPGAAERLAANGMVGGKAGV